MEQQATAKELSGKDALDHIMHSGELSADDRAELDGAHPPDEDDIQDMEDEATTPAGGGPPEWADIPADLKMPDGRVITYVRLRAGTTDTPNAGDRQCIMWNLSAADEKIALKRTRGEALYTLDELTKQFVRSIDGKRVDWGKGTGQIDRWWDAIGGKNRQQLKNIYAKAHSLTAEEQIDFLGSCIAVRTYQAG